MFEREEKKREKNVENTYRIQKYRIQKTKCRVYQAKLNQTKELHTQTHCCKMAELQIRF